MPRRIVDHRNYDNKSTVIKSDALYQVLTTMAPELLSNDTVYARLNEFVDPANETNAKLRQSLEELLYPALDERNRPNLSSLMTILIGMRQFAKRFKAQNLQMLDATLAQQKTALVNQLERKIQPPNFQENKPILHPVKNLIQD